MIVRELMTTDPVTVRPDTRVKSALALLDEHDITTLPVVDASGRLRGVVSEGDLIRDLVEPDPRLREIPLPATAGDLPACVADVMSSPAVAVHPETDLATAVKLATSTATKTLPVVDENEVLVGMLSRRDVVRVLARSDDLLEHEIGALMVSAGLRGCGVEVRDGVARVSGPDDGAALLVAQVLARAVPGVVEVRVA